MRPPVVATLAWLALSPSPVLATEGAAGGGFDAPYLAPKLVFGIGGQSETAIEPDIVSSASLDTTADLHPTFGVAVAYVHPLLEYLAIGAQVEIASWGADTVAGEDASRSVYADASLVVQPRIALRSTVEVHLTLPLGGSLGFTDEAAIAPLLRSRIELDTGIGYHVGALAGVRVALSDRFGLSLDAGYVAHWLHHSVQVPVLTASGAATESTDAELALGQYTAQAGVYF